MTALRVLVTAPEMWHYVAVDHDVVTSDTVELEEWRLSARVPPNVEILVFGLSEAEKTTSLSQLSDLLRMRALMLRNLTKLCISSIEQVYAKAVQRLFLDLEPFMGTGPQKLHAEVGPTYVRSVFDTEPFPKDPIEVRWAGKMYMAVPSETSQFARAYYPNSDWQLRCLKAANTIRRKQANIHLLWAPGHTDIVGNERADYLAKEATKEDPRSTTKSIAYLGTTIKRIQQTEQRQEYKKYKARATALNKATYSAKYPLKISKTIQMPQNTKRVTSSAFYSLKLGHGYFNSYLKRFKKRDSNRCTCQNIQTPEHLLLYCHLYKDHRKTLLQTIKHRPVTLPLLLHTSIGIEATLAFITSTRIGTRKWYLGQPTEDLQRDTV
ncbi:hypothetical protein PtrM4_124250 [Pyrenophora tritici-repentis]|uniref:RNase H type-1 domain-containing protein n=1 Tax=Pyrenophora tritici-repentis TaxID=45151 RepID=A0A834RTW7_9PLEO|nr:hypothetical protein PtrM4_124250 [Pyrenophora tritici-repentis]